VDQIIELSRAGEAGIPLVGGKAYALSRLISAGFKVPGGLCITTEAFRLYLAKTRLSEKILLEINRKRYDQMRWEEMWDTALRIRNLLKNTPLPPAMEQDLAALIEERFRNRPVVVRSSSTIEDRREASHAGLHESYINIKGTDHVLDHVRLVWASLWSDASLLLSEETGLDAHSDAMAVVVQELVEGDRSGVIFTVDPSDTTRAVIESVHGLNKGLVDGDVEPDRWILRKSDGIILEHAEPVRDKAVILSGEGSGTVLKEDLIRTKPLSNADVEMVWRNGRGIENHFGEPQDVEWTFRKKELYILQARPITSIEEEPARGSKAWNLKLKGSFAHLEELRYRIETVHLPRMEAQARELAAAELPAMDDSRLAAEIRQRAMILERWTDIYWDEFIPMAHGVRLFGKVYNDVMGPEDPFEFVELLRQTPMLSTRRNAAMMVLANTVRNDPTLTSSLLEGKVPGRSTGFKKELDEFLNENGDLTWAGSRLAENREHFLKFLVNMARTLPQASDPETASPEIDDLAGKFIERYGDGSQREAERILSLGRASWRLRDDDNVYLGRIEGQLRSSAEEGLRRLAQKGDPVSVLTSPLQVADALEGRKQQQQWKEEKVLKGSRTERVAVRQIVGQPAGKGIARGMARVVTGFSDLATFRPGEVLVCDAIDPNMTLLVPMACAIVERRGGMLIHGAIIARESGIPCVNGVPDATTVIRTGDSVTVDGYLGLVVVHH
jgi:pyruvate,water dikinase